MKNLINYKSFQLILLTIVHLYTSIIYVCCTIYCAIIRCAMYWRNDNNILPLILYHHTIVHNS